MAAANGPNQSAIAIFAANGNVYPAAATRNLYAGSVPTEEARLLCPRLDEGQARVGRAAEYVRRVYSDASPQQFGTAVHTRVAKQINDLNDMNFRAEVSYLKGVEENYGVPGTVRVDVFERASNSVTCVYDIKTGASGLSPARRIAIDAAVRDFNGYEVPRIIVTEVRPNQ